MVYFRAARESYSALQNELRQIQKGKKRFDLNLKKWFDLVIKNPFLDIPKNIFRGFKAF